MARMLGFSDEDKQRIGIAQKGAGKGVVRGVLGLPGRLVGGILGSSSVEAHSAMASDDQVFLTNTLMLSSLFLMHAQINLFYCVLMSVMSYPSD